MPIEFRCAECASSYEVEEDLAGKTIRCRECQGFGRVPTPLVAATPVKSCIEKKPSRLRRLLGTRWFWSVLIPVAGLIFLSAVLIGGISALSWFKQTSRRMPDQADRNALLLAKEGEWQKSFAVIEQAITAEPDRASHWMTRGTLHLSYGNYSKAAEDYQTVLRLDPNNQEASRLLARAQRENQREREARRQAWQEDLMRNEREFQEQVKENARRTREMDEHLRRAAEENARDNARRQKEFEEELQRLLTP